MTDRPILFSAPMTRALLAGTKTQTRRLLKPQPPEGATFFAWDIGAYGNFAAFMTERNANADLHPSRLPAWRGDRLWVREQCATWGKGPGPEPVSDPVVYAADDREWDAIRQEAKINKDEWKVRTSIHMPRWASRLTLTVTEVRVQRLQDISEADAQAEGYFSAAVTPICEFPDCEIAGRSGCSRGECDAYTRWYADLWTSLHGPGSWDANPWVVAVSFDVRKGNIDV